MLGQWPYGGNFALSDDEVQDFLHLWHLLERQDPRFSFNVHRFKLAFDRGLIVDRIVDLVIAAEALFLGDIGPKDRGELGYRFAVRAAKFIEHTNYSEQQIYRIMRDAYNVRSAIVHGGSPGDTRLPDNPSASLTNFTDTVEELVRLGLRKALSTRQNMREPEFWIDLISAAFRAVEPPSLMRVLPPGQ